MFADGPGELAKLTVSALMEQYFDATARIGISASSRPLPHGLESDMTTSGGLTVIRSAAARQSTPAN
jgi:hypothetical protein